MSQGDWNKAIEAAALVVEPRPFKEEERSCKDIAKEIRRLKRKEVEDLP